MFIFGKQNLRPNYVDCGPEYEASWGVNLKTAAVKAENEKNLFQKDFDAQTKMLSKVEEDNKQLKDHAFRTHNHSTYAGAGSMSARGPSPNENVAYNFISPT